MMHVFGDTLIDFKFGHNEEGERGREGGGLNLNSIGVFSKVGLRNSVMPFQFWSSTKYVSLLSYGVNF